MMGHTGLEHVGLAAVRLLPWVNALRSLLPLSPLCYFFFPFWSRTEEPLKAFDKLM